MTTIAVIGMGAMGAAVAARIIEQGGSVVTELTGRSAATVQRAKDAGVEVLTPSELTERSDIMLSIIPPESAVTVAQQYLPLIAKSATPPMFIDCNAIAPVTLNIISERFSTAGLPFGDGSIIGGPPLPGKTGPRLYLSGDVGRQADILKELGLDTRYLSKTLGDASALKMSFAGITKGLTALASAMAIGAARGGALDSMVEELKFAVPELYERFAHQLPRMYDKAYRWDGEMREIAKFLEPEKGAAGMLNGAADMYVSITAAHKEGPNSEIMSILDQFTGRKKGSGL